MQMVGEWLAKNVGTPVCAIGPAAALPGVRRPRQQPRRLHGQHDRVAGAGTLLAPVGAAHHLRLPPDRAVPDANLAAAVLRAGRSQCARDHLARGQHDRAWRSRRDSTSAVRSGATHMGTSFDAWYPGYVDYAPMFKNIPAFWTETAGNQAAPREYTAERPLAGLPRSSAAEPLLEPVAGRLVAPARTPSNYNETAAISTLEYAAKYKDSLLYNRYQAGRDQIAKGKTTAPFALRRSAGAARPGGGRRDAAPPRVRRRARVAVDGGGDDRRRDLPRRHVGGADRPGVRRDGARGARRRRSTPTCASIRAVRRSGPTTRPAGRCRFRWA